MYHILWHSIKVRAKPLDRGRDIGTDTGMGTDWQDSIQAGMDFDYRQTRTTEDTGNVKKKNSDLDSILVM